MTVDLSWWVAALVALVPIAIILVLMIFLRQSAARAGLVGLVATVVLVFTFFDIGEATGLRTTVATLGALAEASFTAVTILWIIFGALCVHHLQVRAGAIDVLERAVGVLSTDPRIIAVLIAWFFALFIEGAAGFGTSVALAAPFLVSFGFRPVAAVTIALVGHSVGVSFGAVGTPILPQIAVTPFSGLEIAGATGLYHVILGWVMLVVVMLIVSRQFEDGELPPRSMVGWVALGAFSFLLPMYGLARWVGPELPTLGGAVVGAAIFVIALRIAGRRRQKDDEASVDAPRAGAILRASSPYLVVIFLILVTRLIPPVQTALMGLEWEWTLFGEFSGRFQPLYHPGTILVLGYLLGGLIQRVSLGTMREALEVALKQLVPVMVALVAMLGISRLMVHSEMIEALAEAAATGAGGTWPFFAPWVGVLGTFVTGSATASNILFTDFQMATAQTLEISPLKTLGAQGFGAAVGNIICPHNIIAGCATVGVTGQEGEILRRTLGACVVYAVLGGIVAWVWVGWF
ncbi:MAG: L-lactate permease [Bradymonadaceae bacterium]